MRARAGEVAQNGLGFFVADQGRGGGHVTTLTKIAPAVTLVETAPFTLAAPTEPGCQ